MFVNPRRQDYLRLREALVADTSRHVGASLELRHLLDDWLKWAESSAKDHDSWESDYPRWTALVQACCAVMRQDPLPDSAVLLVEACWFLSEETEDMSEWASTNLDQCVAAIDRLARSTYRDVRRQVYVALYRWPAQGLPVLRQALSDPDAQCRLSAVEGLIHICPQDHAALALKIIDDPDKFVRELAVELRNCRHPS